MELNKQAFWGILLIYCFISLVLFMFTSGGWSQLIILIYLGSIYSIILALVLLINIAISIKKKHINLKISLISLTILLIVQFIALLANLGGCGDGEGSYRFYERLLGTNGWEYCNKGKEAASLPLDFLGVYFLEIYTWIYVLIFITFIIYTYYRSFKKASIIEI
jgi:hypothetical protein